MREPEPAAMKVLEALAVGGCESAHLFHDAPSGLRAIVVIHDARPGVAGGGVRMRPYPDEAAALADALRLARAMTYKFALARIPIGGAKSVILGDPATAKTPDLLRAFGRCVDSLGGRYICGPDVGTTSEDMAVVGEQTGHVRGAPGESGDTGPATAYGVFQAIRAAVRHRLGRDALGGLRVAVQGAGSVGSRLARLLSEAGARVWVADVDAAAAAACGVEAVAPEDVMAMDVDVLAPCALGGVLDDDTVPAVRAAIVCGGANNQLAGPRHAGALAERGILFVPDFVASAGGAIHAVREGPDFDEADAMAAVARIHDTCAEVLARADRDGITPLQAAQRMAEEAREGFQGPG